MVVSLYVKLQEDRAGAGGEFRDSRIEGDSIQTLWPKRNGCLARRVKFVRQVREIFPATFYPAEIHKYVISSKAI